MCFCSIILRYPYISLCMWEAQPVNRPWPLLCCPMETQTLVVWQEGQSLSCSSLLSDSNISWFHNLHRLLANKSPARPETFCFHSPRYHRPPHNPAPTSSQQQQHTKSAACASSTFADRQGPFPQTCIHDLRSQPLLTPVTPHLLSRHWTMLMSLSGSTPRQKMSTSVGLKRAI